MDPVVLWLWREPVRFPTSSPRSTVYIHLVCGADPSPVRQRGSTPRRFLEKRVVLQCFTPDLAQESGRPVKRLPVDTVQRTHQLYAPWRCAFFLVFFLFFFLLLLLSIHLYHLIQEIVGGDSAQRDSLALSTLPSSESGQNEVVLVEHPNAADAIFL
jgi:hypothetical protein